jgi:hypothetical protein
MENKKSKWFFGWTNVKWIFTEFMNIYSTKKSFFSKKRVESGIAFIIAQWGMIFFLLEKHSSLSMGEFLLWAGAEFAVSGYIINKIQKEKSTVNNQITDSVTQEEESN